MSNNPTRYDAAKIAKMMSLFPCKELDSGNLRTSPFRGSYPNIFERSKSDGDYRSTFGITCLFPKGSKLDVLKEAAQHTAIERFGPKAASMGLKMPFRNQVEKEGKTGYVGGAFFFRATSDDQPGILDLNGKPITDKKAVYPGAWFIATVRPFPFDKKQKGVAFGLQNLIKIADDDAFGGTRAEANDEFSDVLSGAGDVKNLFGEDFEHVGASGGDFNFD